MKLFEDIFTKEQVIDLLAVQNMITYNNEMPIYAGITFEESKVQVSDNFDSLLSTLKEYELKEIEKLL